MNLTSTVVAYSNATWSNASSYEYAGGLEYIRQRLPLIVPYLIILSLTTIIGTFGNLLLFIAVVHSNQLKHVGNYFVVNLGIADFIISSFVNGFAFVGALVGEEYFVDHPLLCLAAASACLITCYCSLLTLTFIAIHRYVFICQNRWHRHIFGKKTTLAACIFIWVTAICLHLSEFFDWGSFTFDRKALSCITDRRASLSHSLYFSTVGIGLPFVTSTVCYTLIYLHVRAVKDKVVAGTGAHASTTGNSAAAKHGSKHAKGTLMLLFIFIAFFLLWLPFAVLFVADHWDRLPGWMVLFALLLGHCNSAINPVLYGATNRSFRNGYLKILCRKRYTDMAKTTDQYTGANTSKF